MGSPELTERGLSNSMTSDCRIATRYVFESRILIRLCRGNQRLALHGWARDLSESGLGAFVAQGLVVGESVSLEIPLSASGKEVIPAKVTCQLGTQYGFQFTALSEEQRSSIRTALMGHPTIPYSDVNVDVVPRGVSDTEPGVQ
jgi:hypothetical protein